MQIISNKLGIISQWVDSRDKKHGASEFSKLPSVLCQKIIFELDFVTLNTFNQTNRLNRILATPILNERIIKEIAFGKDQWFEYFGVDVQEESLLPSNINAILNRPDPDDPTKKVYETHILTLIPRDLSLKCLVKLADIPSNSTSYNIDPFILDLLKIQNETPYWVLLKKEVIGGSRNKKVEKQQVMLDRISKRWGIDYTLPTIFEVAASIFTHQARSGEYLLKATCTYTKEKEVAIGHFTSNSLFLYFSYSKWKELGAVGVLRLESEEIPE